MTIFTGSFLVLALCGGHPAVPDPSSTASGRFKSPEKVLFDPRLAARYESQRQALKAAVTAYFEQAIASGEIVGAGLSIVQGDSIVLSEGFGWSNRQTGARADGETVFRLGSLSKGFTGILAAGLVHEGRLHWDDKVQDALPDFQLGNTANTGKVTLSKILSHSSGAPYHSFTNLVEEGMPLVEVARHFREVAPTGVPGSTYSYQNAIFALSGEMMHRATGQTIDELLWDRLFRPLEMCSVTMEYESLSKAVNVAVPHVKWRKGYKTMQLNHSYYNAIAAGGINASAHDMARWMRFLLGHNPDVMEKQALEAAFTPVIEIKGHAKYYHRWPGHKASFYGYGWRIHHFVEGDSQTEKTIWHHGGSVNDFRNEIALYPEADLGICVLMNSNSPLAKRVIPDLYEIVGSVFNRATPHMAMNQFSDSD